MSKLQNATPYRMVRGNLLQHEREKYIDQSIRGNRTRTPTLSRGIERQCADHWDTGALNKFQTDVFENKQVKLNRNFQSNDRKSIFVCLL